MATEILQLIRDDHVGISQYLVVHPTNRKWVTTNPGFVNGIGGGKSSPYNWGELTHQHDERGMFTTKLRSAPSPAPTPKSQGKAVGIHSSQKVSPKHWS